MWFSRPKTDGESHLERERVRLTEKLLDELQSHDQLRKTILEALGRSGAEYSFWRQPVILLILGSLLTGGLGGFLSSCWQRRESERQQASLATQRSLEQKYQVANDTAKAIGEMQSSSLTVLEALGRDDDESRFSELNRVLEGWRQTRKEWQTRAQVLSSQLSMNFQPVANQTSPDAAARFREITRCYKDLNTGLSNMSEVVMRAKGASSITIKCDVSCISTILNANMGRNMTPQLMNVLAEQIGSRVRTDLPDSPQVIPSFCQPTCADPKATPESDPNPCPFKVKSYDNPIPD